MSCLAGVAAGRVTVTVTATTTTRCLLDAGPVVRPFSPPGSTVHLSLPTSSSLPLPSPPLSLMDHSIPFSLVIPFSSLDFTSAALSSRKPSSPPQFPITLPFWPDSRPPSLLGRYGPTPLCPLPHCLHIVVPYPKDAFQPPPRNLAGWVVRRRLALFVSPGSRCVSIL